MTEQEHSSCYARGYSRQYLGAGGCACACETPRSRCHREPWRLVVWTAEAARDLRAPYAGGCAGYDPGEPGSDDLRGERTRSGANSDVSLRDLRFGWRTDPLAQRAAANGRGGEQYFSLSWHAGERHHLPAGRRDGWTAPGAFRGRDSRAFAGHSTPSRAVRAYPHSAGGGAVKWTGSGESGERGCARV